jgi:AraC-like DNA-binding protein
MLLGGRGVVLQDDRDAVLSPGDFAVWNTSRPYRLEFDETFRILVLMCPHTALRVPARTMARMTAVRLSSQDGVGALVRPFLTGLAGQLDGVSPAAVSHLAAATLEMLAAALTDGDSAESLRGGTLLHRVQSFIEDHLSDPDLTPSTVAAAHHISARYLHKLFERNGETVAGLIRTRRLERCRRDLSAAELSHCPISMIAARWGLHDAARFSKIFRAVYGVSPRQYRQSLARSTTRA